MAINAPQALLREDLAEVLIERMTNDQARIGLQIATPLASAKRSGSYLKIERSQLGRTQSAELAPGSAYPRTSGTITNATFDTQKRGIEVPVPYEVTKDLEDAFDVESVFAERELASSDMLDSHEKRVATAVFNTTNFGAATNSTVAYTTANVANNSFIDDVKASFRRGKQNGVMYNTVVMSGPVWERVSASTPVLNYVRGQDGARASVTPEALANAFRANGVPVERVLVGDSYYNSNTNDGGYTASQIWSNTYVWCGKTAPGGSLEAPRGAIHTIYWNDTEMGGLLNVTSYEEEDRDQTVIRARHYTDEHVADDAAGDLIATQYT